jgi:DNA-binding response OmpR family regulator
MMLNMDGCQFISQLRRTSSIPVIMIAAKQQETDISHGFDLGAGFGICLTLPYPRFAVYFRGSD